VGGFLGSGKTTAIIQASKTLMAQGMRVGVVTNDQGKYLVDTAFVRLSDIPAVEVTGGCFCCNYADLDGSLDQLIESTRPDIVFTESVGSCADLVATVVKPLLSLKQAQAAPTSFSVFADGRLLRRRLRGDPMPFSDDVIYIYDKQLEEAGLVVINKTDLLAAEALEETRSLLKQAYPGKNMTAQNSLSTDGVASWLELLNQGQGLLPSASLKIDYDRYGRGEAMLAWLDEEVRLSAPDATSALRAVIGGFASELRKQGIGVGHLKFLVQAGEFEVKISFPTLDEPGWEALLPAGLSGEVRLLVNARAEVSAENLRELFLVTLRQAGAVYGEEGVSYFHPKQPNPTHRYL
jgi:Ni2+-binding GTPase involved in maturation of urease and hydrogenase